MTQPQPARGKDILVAASTSLTRPGFQISVILHAKDAGFLGEKLDSS